MYDDELLGFARQEREVVCHLIVVYFRAAADLDDDHVREQGGGSREQGKGGRARLGGGGWGLLSAPSSLDSSAVEGTAVFFVVLDICVSHHQMGWRPGNPRPDVSSNPSMMFMHCTAVPAAPFIRLSMAAIVTTRFAVESSSVANPISQ